MDEACGTENPASARHPLDRRRIETPVQYHRRSGRPPRGQENPERTAAEYARRHGRPRPRAKLDGNRRKSFPGDNEKREDLRPRLRGRETRLSLQVESGREI